MKTRLVVVAAFLLAGFSVSEPLYACGEKFLMRSRGTRFQRVAALRKPASILVYANPQLNLPKALANASVDATLRKAGYRPTTVTSAAEFASAMGQGKWDLVVVDVADTSAVTKQTPKAPAPIVLPVLLNPTSQEMAVARKQHQRAVKGPVKSQSFLDAVDDALAEKSSDEKSRQ
jgi:hypothetical protein